MTRLIPVLMLSCLAAACGDTGLTDSADMGMDLSASGRDGGKGDMRMSMAMCDLVKQNCSDTSKPKCAIEIDQQAQAINKVCVAEGTAADGESCSRPNMTVGEDSCKRGLFCTARGLPAGQLACRKFCQKDGDCSANQKCSTLQGKDGICTPTCTPFGTGCPTGTACGTIHTGVGATQADPKAFVACRPTGTVPLYGDCSGNGTECVANASCEQVSQTEVTCLPFCDNAHTCPQPAGPLPDGGVAYSCTAFGDVNICDNTGP